MMRENMIDNEGEWREPFKDHSCFWRNENNWNRYDYSKPQPKKTLQKLEYRLKGLHNILGKICEKTPHLEIEKCSPEKCSNYKDKETSCKNPTE